MLFKRKIIDHVKHIQGVKTKRKIIAFAVDDYGNVRVHSKEAREKMDMAGLKAISPFDKYDTLENKEDLEILFDTLASVKDKNNHSACFTPFALPCNIDFEKMQKENYSQYHYELLPKTYEKLTGYNNAYSGAWQLWLEGIQKGLLCPQFHGREHINLKSFNQKLQEKDKELLASLQNRSYTSISKTNWATISPTAAFDFWQPDENKEFESIIVDGLKCFEEVFGFSATHFNAPGASESSQIHPVLIKNGIKYIDNPWIKKEHLGYGKYKRKINYTGKIISKNLTCLVRNVVFEPSVKSYFDWADYTLSQIEKAFYWNKPVIISSHRVNFSGHIDKQNRKNGIDALAKLLKQIVKRWPDVEFMSTIKLGEEVNKLIKINK